VALRLSDHARQRLRDRHLPLEAVMLVIAQPERVDVLDEGTWNERQRSIRRVGRLRIAVVWTWEHDDRFVMTVTVDPAQRPMTGE